MGIFKAILFCQLCIGASASRSIRGGNRQRELKRDSRIIGGSAVRDGEHTYAVSLQDGVGHFCGGSLIAPNIVLGAAHCRQNRRYKAVIDRRDLKTNSGDVRTVIKEIPHPSYNPTKTDNDYMIMVLDRDTEADVDPVKVSTEVVSEGKAVTVVGWGDVHPSGSVTSLATQLMGTEVFSMSNDDCKRSSGVIGGQQIFGMTFGGYQETYGDDITDNMLCAEDNGEDSCQGDSGGPLVVETPYGDELVGVVSWGIGCAHPEFPGVYARVSAQYPWIKSVVCAESSSPPASFGCGGATAVVDLNPPTASVEETQDLSVQVPQGSINEDGWTLIQREDFTGGYLGLFHHSDNNVVLYLNAVGRSGAVRINNGDTFKSKPLNLQNNPYELFKVGFSFYASQMEDSDELCLHYDLDDGKINGRKCWSKDAFVTNKWYDDVSIVFEVTGASSLTIRFSVEGYDSDSTDHVLIDSVAIEGL
ncbi:hypothetical protein ACHAWF_012515 [Thalassiosira exigua]